MTNSHSQFPSSQIRRTAQMQSLSAAHPYLNQRLYQPLSQPSTTDLPSAIQRPRSAAPSRNVSSTSLSTMSKGMNSLAKDRECDYWIPEYLEGTAYGVWVSNWKEQGRISQSNYASTNGSGGLMSISMRREASTSQTVPSSRNPSPHNHSHPLAHHRGVTFDVTERPSSSSLTSSGEPPLLPSRFNERDRCPVLELLNDGMDAKFGGPAKGTDSDAASVRADHPIPSSCGIYYYEVTIIARGSQGYSPVLF
jgi:Ran-binding protein 9/10